MDEAIRAARGETAQIHREANRAAVETNRSAAALLRRILSNQHSSPFPGSSLMIFYGAVNKFIRILSVKNLYPEVVVVFMFIIELTIVL